MNKHEIVLNFEHVGTVKTVEDIGFRLLNKLCFFKILRAIKVERVDPELLKCDERFQGLLLPESMLRKFSRSPEYQLSEAFLDQALEKGDQCYGFLDGDALASYGWYSNKPTEIAWPGLVFHFDDRYAYMYKAFTHPSYRGHRLHAIGKTRALSSLLTSGYRGLVSYIEWNNFDSLRSNHRMRHADLGTIYLAGIFRDYYFYCDAGCKRNGIRLERVRPLCGQTLAVSRR